MLSAYYTFYVVCKQAIRNNTVIMVAVPLEYTYNNPISNSYSCWSDYRPNLLQESCLFTYQNGSYYLITQPINVLSNQIEINLNFFIFNPLIGNVYTFTSVLLHAGQVYSTTNPSNITIYTQNNITNISSVTVDYLPKNAGSTAIYFIRISTANIDKYLEVIFGSVF